MEEEDGCGISVVDVHARYRAPARYDAELALPVPDGLRVAQ